MGGGGKGGGGGGKTKNYFGTIGGIICAGPVDELVAVIIDGATAWPTNAQWNDGVVNLPVVSFSRTANFNKITFGVPHGLTKSDKFVTDLFTPIDSTFQESTPVSPSRLSAYSIEWLHVGSNVADTPVIGPTMSKVKHYTSGTIVIWSGSAWQSRGTHDATPDKVPPNATWWDAYSVHRGSSANPYDFTIPNYGRALFYWGTSSQGLCTYLSGHPPYRNQAYIVLIDFFFGMERQGPPNIEVLVRKKPDQDLVGAENALDDEGQANPLAIATDVFTHPIFGLGLDNSFLDDTSFGDVMGALDDAAAHTYLSPLLDKAQSARAFFAQLLAYFDGWFRFTTAGVMEAGRFLHNEAPPSFTDATTIDFNDLADGEEIEFDGDGWPATFNETVVKFMDGAKAFKDAGQMSANGFNRQVTGAPTRAIIDRQWITRQAQAASHAAEWGKINAQTKISGTLTVRAEKAASINQGDLFELTHDALSLSIVCRCTNKTISPPPKGTVTMRFENERGIAPLPFSPTVAGPIGPIAPGLERIDLYQFFQPPPTLGTEAEFQLALLAARTSELTRGVAVWLQLADASLFYQLGQQTEWAVQGTLSQDYPLPTAKATVQRSRSSNVATLKVTAHGLTSGMRVAITGVSGTGYNTDDATITVTDADHFTYPNTGSNEGVTGDTGGTETPLDDDDSASLRVNLGDFTVQADLDRLAQTQTDDAVDDDATLAILFRVSDGAMEIMTMKSIALVSGVYRLTVRRGQLSTNKFAFVTGDSIWLVRRGDIVSYHHQKFNDAGTNGDSATLRLQSFTSDQSADLDDANICPDITYTFTDPWAPSLGWIDLEVRNPGDPDFSDIADLTASFSIDASFRFRFRTLSPVALLSIVKVIARQGAFEQILYSRSFNPTGSYDASFIFKLPYEGQWEIIGIVGDWARRSQEFFLTAVGDTTEAFLHINGPALTCAQPTIPTGGHTVTNGQCTVVITGPTSGSTIHYRSRVSSGAFGWGAWTGWTAAGANPATVTFGVPFGHKTNVECYASKSGLNDSIKLSFTLG